MINQVLLLQPILIGYNSSNLHPEQQRMISIREGARLQSFKDSFVFYGSKTSL